jgi:hypothetical protein
MMSKSFALSSVALIALITPVSASAQAPAAAAAPAPVASLIKKVDIPYQRFTLPNGLRVIVHTDRKAPVVAVSVWYNIGSKFEPNGRTGFAHLFEHLMFNETKNLPAGRFDTLLERAGAETNAATWNDWTYYYENVPADQLALVGKRGDVGGFTANS